MRRNGRLAGMVGSVFALYFCILFPGDVRGGEGSGSISPDTFDCGTIALYQLLRFESRPVGLGQVQDRLPRPGERGHSMRQLRDAARSFGLRLEGVRLQGGDHAPDRPMVAFVKRKAHGHFIAVRPVGHTGRLVQVLDSASEPVLLDAVDLYHSPGWTGLALIPSRTRGAVHLAFIILVSLVVTGLLWILLRLFNLGGKSLKTSTAQSLDSPP